MPSVRGTEEDEAARVYDSSTVDVVYLKAINVPTMYDVGTLPVDPTDGRLCLNIMDLFNYHKVVKPDFQKLRMQKSKVSKLRQVMQALHVNLQVSEVRITVLGEVKLNLKTGLKEDVVREAKDPVIVPIVIDGVKREEPLKRIVIS